jgi:Rrf2 family protein
MIFSKPCQYAILAMTYLGGQERGSLRSIREISEQIEVPLPFLSKVISTLSRKGLVTSRRGPKGGVTLGRPASRLTVGDIVEAIDGPLESGRCILGFAECCGKAPCPLHDTWNEARGKLEQALHRKTLLDLTRKRNDANTEKRRFEAHPRR